MSSGIYIAADFGASSGRVMLAEIDKTIRLQEIHRFPNHQILNLGHYQWDLLGLFQELKTGLSKIAHSGHRRISGIGIDTWGVDFGFVGRNDSILGNPYCYRDNRTQGMVEKAFENSSRCLEVRSRQLLIIALMASANSEIAPPIAATVTADDNPVSSIFRSVYA